MTPIGQYIKILTPEPIYHSYFIVEEEPVVKAVVEEISVDAPLPFKPGNTVFFYRNRHIQLKDGIYLPLDMIVGYSS